MTVLLHVFPSFVTGGSQLRFAALANHFGRRFRHIVVSMDGRISAQQWLNASLDVEFPADRYPSRDTLRNLRAFRKLLEARCPDCLITYNWGSIECAMANWPGRWRHVHIEDGFGLEEAVRQLPRRALIRRYVLRGSAVVLPSRTLLRIAKEVWRLNPHHLHYVPNGVDCARFSAPDIVPLSWRTDRPVIGTVAALRPEKNIARLIGAFAKLQERLPCRLLIAGDGPELTRLQDQARPLGDDVMFAGHVTRTEAIYAALALFALSSDTEQMPTSVLEAMAAGLPVAATDVGDVRTMLCGENQPFVTPRDETALADAMFALLQKPLQARRIGAANRLAAWMNFHQDKMFTAYEALFSGRVAAAA